MKLCINRCPMGPPGSALIIHCVRWAAEDPGLDRPNVVDLQSIEAG